MKRRTQRANQRKSRKKTKGQKSSSYARKRAYLAKNGGMGFDYPEPKPWKG